MNAIFDQQFNEIFRTPKQIQAELNLTHMNMLEQEWADSPEDIEHFDHVQAIKDVERKSGAKVSDKVKSGFVSLYLASVLNGRIKSKGAVEATG